LDKNKIMMIAIIALLVTLLLGVGAVAVLVLRMPNSQTEQSLQMAPGATEVNPEFIKVVPISQNISTNLLTDVDGSRHDIRFGISLGIDITNPSSSEELIALLIRQEAIVRDIALGVVRNKTFNELNRPDGRPNLANEILVQLQETFRTNLIVEVYITEFFLV
jgi:flagellar basal body-associated protein FliL